MTMIARAVAVVAAARNPSSAGPAAERPTSQKMIYRTMMTRPRADLRNVPPHRLRLVVRHRSLKALNRNLGVVRLR
jgi:hypothetical protein